jgi:hypothetical protein
MKRLTISIIPIWALALGAAQAKVLSSSVSTGEIPNPSADAGVRHPSHRAILEVRATPRAPVEVFRQIECYSSGAPGHQLKGVIIVRPPARIPMPILVRDPINCVFHAFAFFMGYGQHGRIALRIRY